MVRNAITMVIIVFLVTPGIFAMTELYPRYPSLHEKDQYPYQQETPHYNPINNLYPPSAPLISEYAANKQGPKVPLDEGNNEFANLIQWYESFKLEINRSILPSAQSKSSEDQDIAIEKSMWRFNPNLKYYTFYLFKEAMQDKKIEVDSKDWENFSSYMLANGALPKFNSSEFKDALNYVLEAREIKTLSYLDYAKYMGLEAANRAVEYGGKGALLGIGAPILLKRSKVTPKQVGQLAVVGAATGAVSGLGYGGYQGFKKAQTENERFQKEQIPQIEGRSLKQNPGIFKRLRSYFSGKKIKGTH